MRYHPQALVIAVLAAIVGYRFVTALLFPDASAAIAEAFYGEAAPMMWLALIAVLIVLSIYIRANKPMIDRVLTGQASFGEAMRSLFRKSGDD
ncbi:MAG: hypothetical protein Q8N35_01185 [Methylococcaceae bacterium]|nr:hypothetical protein [Methylococcaceae bacterium]MDZ4156463.1 hypothetical protein [Methylococcales bacterium]MDP2391679.1 hypothetical protein [Methylococcaceae bacterium]MDP3018178.1 hypothetical protein [Methylococcaceae bacterium]MDP3389391.1 hypothetical protein [Methylococcaceae bacterium]